MKAPSRAAIVHGFFVLFAIGLVARAAKVQVVEGKQWSMRATRQHFFANSSSVRRILGSLDGEGNPLGGLELSLDTLLRGDSGKVRLARDRDGRALDSPDAWTDQPKAGATVVLTINNTLQDICERELSIAVDSLHADGGDIVVMN